MWNLWGSKLLRAVPLCGTLWNARFRVAAPNQSETVLEETNCSSCWGTNKQTNRQTDRQTNQPTNQNKPIKPNQNKIDPCENPNGHGEIQYEPTASKTELSMKSNSAKHKTTASFGTSIWGLKDAWWSLPIPKTLPQI